MDRRDGDALMTIDSRSYRLDNIDVEKIKVSDLKGAQEATKKKLTFKND